MKYFSKGLLTLPLISLFILNSCKNPSGIGLDVTPGDEIYGQLTDTLSIQAVTLRDDSILNNGSAFQTSFGYLKDPVIGETQSDLAFNIGAAPAGTDPRIPANAVVDSAILILRYGNSAFFGDTLHSSFQLEVRQLDEIFEPATYSNKVWAVKPTVIGSKTLARFATRDSISIIKTSSGKDSTIRVPAQLRIRLDNAFIKQLLKSDADSAAMASEGTFMNYVKGFYLSVNKEAQTGIGGIVHLNLNNTTNDAYTGLEVYYKTPADGSADDKPDTVSLRFPMNSVYSASAVKHTYTQQITDVLNNPVNPAGPVFVQALGGLRTRISFPTFDGLKKRKLAINKAQLVIYTDQEATGTEFTEQAPRLTLYREDLAKQRQAVPDGDTRINGNNQYIGDPRSLEARSGFTGGFGGFYDKAQKRYIFNLTSYIQDLLLNKIQSNAVYLSPILPEETVAIPYAPTANTGSRAILAGPGNTGYRMKLNIYYTELD